MKTLEELNAEHNELVILCDDLRDKLNQAEIELSRAAYEIWNATHKTDGPFHQYKRKGEARQ